MSSAFLTQGVATYFGFTDEVRSRFNDEKARELFTNLVDKRQTTGEAFTDGLDPDLKKAYFEIEGAENLALLLSPKPFVIPTADIIIDGDITDWQDIPVVAISPQAPPGTYPLGADVKSLKLAKKGNFLYYLFEVWDPSIDPTGEVGYRLWFDNNKNGIINGDPEDRQVSSRCQNGVCQVWSQAMDGFIDADGFAQSSDSFIETSVRADILGIWPSFRLESGTHSETAPVSFDRFPPVEEIIYQE